jgi:chemotaxis signal transduction protein
MNCQHDSVGPPDVISTQNIRYCVFRNDLSWFAVPSLEVREVMNRPETVFIPGTPDLFIGLCHVRSEFIPVLNLKSVLAEPSESNEKILIILDDPDGVWGFLADEVASLQDLDISDAPEADCLEGHCTVIGWATSGDVVIQILDSSRIRQLAEQELAVMWQSTHPLVQ